MHVFLFLFLIPTTTAIIEDPPLYRVSFSDQCESSPSGHIFSEDLFSIPHDPDDSLNSNGKKPFNMDLLSRFFSWVDEFMNVTHLSGFATPGFTHEERLLCPSGRLFITRIPSRREPYALIRKGIATIWMYSPIGDLRLEHKNCSNGETHSGVFPDNGIYIQVSVIRDGKPCVAKLERYKIVHPSSVFGGPEQPVVVNPIKELEDYATKSFPLEELTPRQYHIFFERMLAFTIDKFTVEASKNGVDAVCNAFGI